MTVPGDAQEQHQNAAVGSVGEVIPRDTGGPDGERIESFGLFPAGQQGREMSVIL